jgi:hypothetical protein
MVELMIVRATQGNGQMPDGTSRFKCKGQDIKHFVRISTILTHLCLFNLSSICQRPRGEKEEREKRKGNMGEERGKRKKELMTRWAAPHSPNTPSYPNTL